MSSSLRGRRLLLTGASRGIGRRCVEVLLDAGAEVIGSARTLESLEGLVGSAGFRGVAADLSRPDAAAKLRDAVAQRWGALDVLVHNAGIMLAHSEEICSEPEGVLEQTLDVNLLAPHRITRALLPLLERGEAPRIVNVSSDAGTHDQIDEPGLAAYRLSKWALNGLTMLQAKELAGRVSVLALHPGWVRTDMGGEQAPGDTDDSARGLLAVLALPPERTGQLYFDGQVMAW